MMNPRLSLLAALLVAGCIPQIAPPAPRPTSAPPPASRPTATPTPTPTPSGDWRDWALTPGDWVYRQDARGSISLFGVRGADAAFTIRCDKAHARIYLSRAGTVAGDPPMTIITTSMTRHLKSQPTGGTPAYMATALMPSDRLFDAMGFSRGRFIVEQAGLPTLVIPAYPEVLRVTEDCRK